MKSFLISHLSDLHLTATPYQKRLEAKISGQLGGMNAAFDAVLRSQYIRQSDLVLVTGDITDRGDEESWNVFRDACVKAQVQDRVLAIIGNHDVCGLSSRLGWPPRLSQNDLARAARGLKAASQPTAYPFAKVFDSRIAVVGLDSNNSGNLTPIENALGRLGAGQLAELDKLLSINKEIPVKIVALHHSPNIPEKATALRRGIPPTPLVFRWTHQIPQEERRELRQICLKHKVRLVVHGHLHQAEDRRVNGLRIIGAPATTEPKDPNSRYPEYCFFQYLVHGVSNRLSVSVRCV